MYDSLNLHFASSSSLSYNMDVTKQHKMHLSLCLNVQLYLQVLHRLLAVSRVSVTPKSLDPQPASEFIKGLSRGCIIILRLREPVHCTLLVV